jgi:hypothetical protein
MPLGDVRFLAWTEIVATNTLSSPDGTETEGGRAVFDNFNSSTLIFEGGLYEGATATTQPAVVRARGGDAVAVLNGFPKLNFHDGVYRGGSVMLHSSAPINGDYEGAYAVWVLGNDSQGTVNIYGGLFEGGTVSMAATPDTIISQAPALALWSSYGGTADIYGGEFIGGIEIRRDYTATRLTFHGSDLDIQPPPVNGRVLNAKATVSGRYADGSPFAHDVTGAGGLYVYRGADYLALDPFNVPEPSASALVMLGCGLLATQRRRVRRIPAIFRRQREQPSSLRPA